MASMKKEEARRAVLSEYDRWAKKHPNKASMMGGFLFFRYLQDERSDLLDFRAVGDEKWQIVHGWLRIGWKIRLTHPSKAKGAELGASVEQKLADCIAATSGAFFV